MKPVRQQNTHIDSIDRRLLDLLQGDARASYAELGAAVGLSVSAVNERIRKLVARGAIRSFSACVDPHTVGMRLAAFVRVLLERPAHERRFLAAIAALPAVQECHHVTGAWSYLLKVRVPGAAELEALLAALKVLPGVARTETHIALSSPKESARIVCADGAAVRRPRRLSASAVRASR